MAVIGTWNLENLFLPGADAGPTSTEAYETKLDSLAATIVRAAPDVLAVQEVGSPEALADLVTRLPGEWHTELAEPDARGIRVGLLARTPSPRRPRPRGFPSPWRRCRSPTTAAPSSRWAGPRSRRSPISTAPR
ncbi:hypothetical protein ACFSVJ_00205 [Prauserella oleivorans]